MCKIKIWRSISRQWKKTSNFLKIYLFTDGSETEPYIEHANVLEVLYMAVSMCVQGCMKLYVYIGMCLASVVGERKNHQGNDVGIKLGKAQKYSCEVSVMSK